jgi:sugar O-acyltransferase (sialic acid O-acetyltransferase NeuD family)
VLANLSCSASYTATASHIDYPGGLAVEKVIFGLFGAGGFGREVMPYVKASVARTLDMPLDGIEVFFVETWEPAQSQINGYPLISMEKFFQIEGDRYFNVAVGDGSVRETIATQVGASAKVMAVHAPQAIFLDNNRIAEGSVFCPNTMVTSNATIGRFFQANIYSYVAHDCVIGDFVTFAPGVRCNGRVHIDDYAYIGTNAILKEGTPDKPLRIGAGAIVGMGAVVTKDVPAGVAVIGNPAREMVRK